MVSNLLLVVFAMTWARVDTGGQRRFHFHSFLHGMIEEIGHRLIINKYRLGTLCPAACSGG